MLKNFLNILDPFLLGLDRFQSGWGEWNASLRHFLTPFGFQAGANLFLRLQKLTKETHLFIKGMCYSNVSIIPGPPVKKEFHLTGGDFKERWSQSPPHIFSISYTEGLTEKTLRVFATGKKTNIKT